MKLKLLQLLCLIAFAAPLRADLESDRAALRVIKAAYEEACRAGDPQKLAPHLGANATAVMVTGEEVAGLQGIQQYWSKIQTLMGPGGTYATTVNVDQTEIFGDLSVSRGTTDDLVRIAGGRELKFNSRWTAICLRETNGWKIHRLQASLDPIQNVFIDARVSGAKLTFGLAGLALGAIAAALLVRRKRTRPTAGG
jgi:ketosteroid isomerase-like protein